MFFLLCMCYVNARILREMHTLAECLTISNNPRLFVIVKLSYSHISIKTIIHFKYYLKDVFVPRFAKYLCM